MSRFDLENSPAIHQLPLRRDFEKPHLHELEEAVEYAARMLPAEGPVSAFAFQNLPFETAVKQAARAFGCPPYLPEARYRTEFERGRIQALDLRAEIEED